MFVLDHVMFFCVRKGWKISLLGGGGWPEWLEKMEKVNITESHEDKGPSSIIIPHINNKTSYIHLNKKKLLHTQAYIIYIPQHHTSKKYHHPYHIPNINNKTSYIHLNENIYLLHTHTHTQAKPHMNYCSSSLHNTSVYILRLYYQCLNMSMSTQMTMILTNPLMKTNTESV